MLDRGADMEIKDINGRTAIFYARNMDVARLLISRGANLDVVDNEGLTPRDINPIVRGIATQ